MQKTSFKIATIVLSMLMIVSMGVSMTLMPTTSAHIPAQQIPTLSFINVAPDPIGVGQAATVDFWLAVPTQTSERATGMTVIETDPTGHQTTLGPFTSDITGGTTTIVTPDQVGTYTFQMFYAGQNLTVGAPATSFAGDILLPSNSSTVSLTVQSQAITGIPFTPLPTSWWQTPINAENVQNWYAISGPWLGIAANAFGATGAYNDSGNFNPYTTGPTTGHILWTMPWAIGGVAGGDAGGSETSGYWGTSQYEPKWNPVVIDGIEYATQYTTTTGYNNGIVATDLYTGQTLWVINTTNALVCGMQISFETPNQYGVVGPYLLTTGTLPASDTGGKVIPTAPGTSQYNIYDALTGKYLASIVNGTTPGAGFSGGFLAADANGNLIGYYTNYTYGTTAKPTFQVTHPSLGQTVIQSLSAPALMAWNLTMAMGESGQWSIAPDSVYNFDDGVMYANPSIPTTLNGQTLITQGFFGPSGLNGGGLSQGQIASNVIVLTSGGSVGGSPGETAGWLVEAGFDQTSGNLLWIVNRTETPYTRLSENFYNLAGNGVFVDCNENTFVTTGYSLYTGAQLWTTTLTINGSLPNTYDVYGIQNVVDSGTGIIYLWGLGGDVWALNITTGKTLWTYSTGSSGFETPYGVWPLWVQYGGVIAGQNNMIYLSEGHEYSPPLFHGAQMLALNATTGQLVWSQLMFADTAAEVSYGIMTTYNSYDNQIYAIGQGPSKTTVTAPDVATTIGQPVVIRGTVTDVSAGASQSAVAKNFPNGLPAVSDASMGHFMEYVYEQQVKPTDTTGVPVTISVIDSNNNLRTIGSTTTDATGTFGFTWLPDIPGNYTVIATFAGSGGYYGSSADTYMYAVSSSSSPTPTATTSSNLATQATLIDLGIAIIVVIIIIGAVLALLMMRKRA